MSQKVFQWFKSIPFSTLLSQIANKERMSSNLDTSLHHHHYYLPSKQTETIALKSRNNHQSNKLKIAIFTNGPWKFQITQYLDIINPKYIYSRDFGHIFHENWCMPLYFVLAWLEECWIMNVNRSTIAFEYCIMLGTILIAWLWWGCNNSSLLL